jgi:soluble lytic murein transglycosylase-like protein
MTILALAAALAWMGHPHATPADLARARLLASSIQLAACRHRVDAVLLASIAAHESNFDRSRVGKLGERGRWQLMPATARHLGFIGNDAALAQDPINADLAAAWLAHVRAACATHGHTAEVAYVSKYRGDRCRSSAYSRAIVAAAEAARGSTPDGARSPGRGPVAGTGTARLVGALTNRSKTRKD